MICLTKSRPTKSARETAVDCLSRRALTYRELETRLTEKGYEGAEIEGVLKRLLEMGYLNDQELALTFSRDRLQRYSRRRVQQDLRNRGIEPELIEQALGSNYSGDDELLQCLTLAKRWWVQEGKRWDQRIDHDKTKKSLPRELWLQQKIARKLVHRGYPSIMVQNVLYQIQKLNNADAEAEDSSE